MNQKLLAQSLGNIGGAGLGPFDKGGMSGGSALGGITRIVSAVIGIMTLAAVIWFMFQVIVGGIAWISSGGDKHSLENARNRITHGFIGLIIVIAAWAILAVVSTFLGYDFLITNPDSVFQNLRIN